MSLNNKQHLVETGYTKLQFRQELSALYDHVSGLLGTSGSAADAQVSLKVPLAGGFITARTTRTVTTSDRGRVFLCYGTWTLTLPDPATAGAGFSIAVKNAGSSGVITLDTDGTGEVDITELGAGASAFMVSTGSNWKSIGSPPPADLSEASGILPIAKGGTGSTTAAEAATSLSFVKRDNGARNVGSILLAATTTEGSAGDPYAGADLTQVGLFASTVGGGVSYVTNATLSGTWRALAAVVTGSGNTAICLFQRIA